MPPRSSSSAQKKKKEKPAPPRDNSQWALKCAGRMLNATARSHLLQVSRIGRMKKKAWSVVAALAVVEAHLARKALINAQARTGKDAYFTVQACDIEPELRARGYPVQPATTGGAGVMSELRHASKKSNDSKKKTKKKSDKKKKKKQQRAEEEESKEADEEEEEASEE